VSNCAVGIACRKIVWLEWLYIGVHVDWEKKGHITCLVRQLELHQVMRQVSPRTPFGNSGEDFPVQNTSSAKELAPNVSLHISIYCPGVMQPCAVSKRRLSVGKTVPQKKKKRQALSRTSCPTHLQPPFRWH